MLEGTVAAKLANRYFEKDVFKVIRNRADRCVIDVKGIWDPTYRSFKFRYRQLMKQLKSDKELTREKISEVTT